MFESLAAMIENGVGAKPKDLAEVPVDSLSAQEVEELKAELEEKLRKAEVELSINRAKISQQTNKMEQLQADLERREATLQDTLERQKSSRNEGDKKGEKGSSLMDRWKRHMG